MEKLLSDIFEKINNDYLVIIDEINKLKKHVEKLSLQIKKLDEVKKDDEVKKNDEVKKIDEVKKDNEVKKDDTDFYEKLKKELIDIFGKYYKKLKLINVDESSYDNIYNYIFKYKNININFTINYNKYYRLYIENKNKNVKVYKCFFNLIEMIKYSFDRLKIIGYIK